MPPIETNAVGIDFSKTKSLEQVLQLVEVGVKRELATDVAPVEPTKTETTTKTKDRRH